MIVRMIERSTRELNFEMISYHLPDIIVELIIIIITVNIYSP